MAVSDPKSYDVTAEDGFPVLLPSGSEYVVLTEAEREYMEDKIRRYTTDNHFTNVVDLTDLDKLLVNEMLIHRWGLWLARGRDYYDDDISVKQYAELMNSYQTQCRGLKKSLNLDKVSRDRAHGDDSIPAYWDALRQRAQEFGVMRNAQFNQVLESFQRVKAMLQFYDNCLAGDTMVITSSGTKRIDELVGTAELLDGNGGWVSCNIEAMGVQPLLEVTLQRNRTTKVVRATAEHRWFARKSVSDGVTRELLTTELNVGDRLVTILGRRRHQEPSPWGVAHGITFGDGTREGVRGAGCKVRLCGEKDRQLLKWFPLSNTRTVEGDLVVTGLPYTWKDAPGWEMDSAYLFGWLAGYFAADGSVDEAGSAHLDSAKRAHVEFARDVCYRLGIPTLGVSSYVRDGFDGPAEMWRLRFPVGAIEDEFFLIDEHQRRNRPRVSRAVLPDWKVVSVRSVGKGRVYCPRVPTTRSFVLADNLLTGNCDEQERLEQHCTMADLVEVMREEITAFDAIDDEFKQTVQRLWIRKQ